MKKLYKIINALNSLVQVFVSLIVKVYKKIVPEKIQKQIIHFLDKISNKFNHYRNSVKQFIQKRQTASKKTKVESDAGPIDKIRSILGKASSLTRSFNLKKFSLKKAFSSLSLLITKYVSPLATKFQKWFTSLKPGSMLLVVVLFTITALVILGIMLEGRKIYFGQALMSQNKIEILPPNPHQSKIRPSYFRRILPEKQVDIQEVTFPIYIESIKSVRTLIIDITMETSNRYLAKFFAKNSKVVYDRFHSTFHPIIPSFPLTNEGKQVIRQKIIDEINSLIQDLGLEGHVKEVYFQNIIMA